MLVPIFNNHAVEIVSYGYIPSKSLVGTIVHHDDGTTEWVDDTEFGSPTVRVRLCDEKDGHYVTLLMEEVVLREMPGPAGLGWCCRTLLREVRFGDESRFGSVEGSQEGGEELVNTGLIIGSKIRNGTVEVTYVMEDGTVETAIIETDEVDWR